MSRFNCWIHYIGDESPTLVTYFNESIRNAERLAHAYVAQSISSQGWAKTRYILSGWVEEVTV